MEHTIRELCDAYEALIKQILDDIEHANSCCECSAVQDKIEVSRENLKKLEPKSNIVRIK